MSNPILAFVEKYAGADFVPRVKAQVLGVLEDFWKNPACEFPLVELKLAGRSFRLPNLLRPLPLGAPAQVAPSGPVVNPVSSSGIAPQRSAPPAPPVWIAKAGEVAEKMWGDAQLLPAGDFLLDMLIGPLGLTKTMNVIDLTAGLSGTMQKLLGHVSQMKGFEIDPAIAARGNDILAKAGKAKQATITVYDPAEFSQPATIDVIIARELFYRIADKPKFLYSIAACLKPRGQLAFTDYVVDHENREKPAILSWQENEQGAKPIGLIDMAEAWAKVGLELRISEDQTDFFKREIVVGLTRLVKFLQQGSRPDAETKKTILREVEIWVRRRAAIEHGMKFYRFHAIKS